jgi:putative addiction module killer protein
MIVNKTKFYDKWFKKLRDDIAIDKISMRIRRMEEQGHLGDYKPVGDGLFEVRIDCGPGYRIYFGFENDKIIILLLGGDKSSQRKDIEKARQIFDSLN